MKQREKRFLALFVALTLVLNVLIPVFAEDGGESVPPETAVTQTDPEPAPNNEPVNEEPEEDPTDPEPDPVVVVTDDGEGGGTDPAPTGDGDPSDGDKPVKDPNPAEDEEATIVLIENGYIPGDDPVTTVPGEGDGEGLNTPVEGGGDGASDADPVEGEGPSVEEDLLMDPPMMMSAPMLASSTQTYTQAAFVADEDGRIMPSFDFAGSVLTKPEDDDYTLTIKASGSTYSAMEFGPYFATLGTVYYPDGDGVFTIDVYDHMLGKYNAITLYTASGAMEERLYYLGIFTPGTRQIENFVPVSKPAVTYEDKVVIVKEDGTPYPMFPITDTKVIEDNGKYTVSFKETRGTYSGIYFGAAFDENKTIEASPTDGVYTFSITADEIGRYQPVAFYNPNKEHWVETTYYLGIKNLTDDTIAELVPVVKPEEPSGPVLTPITVPASPAEEQYVSGSMYVHKDTSTDVYSMFKVPVATAIKDNGTIYATIYVSPASSGTFTYSYLYFGTRTELVAAIEKGGQIPVVAGAETTIDGTKYQAYHFTLPESAENTNVPVCIVKSDLTASSPYNSSELELSVPVIPAAVHEPVLTPVTVPA